MKKIIFILLLIFFFQPSFAQQFHNIELGNNSAVTGIETEDKGFIIPVSHFNYKNTIDLYKLNINLEKRLKFSYLIPKNNDMDVRQIIQLADERIILGGLCFMLDSLKGDAYLLILNACYEPEKFIIFNEQKHVEYIEALYSNSSTKNSYTIALHGANPTGTANAMFFMNPEHLNDTVLNRKNTFVVNATEGKGHANKHGEYYFIGESYRSSLGSFWQSEKAAFFKSDTNQNLYWEKIFILNDTNRYYYGRDFAFANADETELMCLIGDRQPDSTQLFVGNSTALLKTDSAGNIFWKKIISDVSHNEDPMNIGKLDDDKFVVTAAYHPIDPSLVEAPPQTYCKVYLVDSNGQVIDTNFVGKKYVEYHKTKVLTIPDHLSITSDKKIFIAGGTYYYDGIQFKDYDMDAFATKLNADLTVGTKVLDTFKYDTQCTKTLKDTTYTLPAPEIITVILDSFYYTPVKSENWTLSIIPQWEPSAVEVKAYPNPFNTGVTLETEQRATVIVCNILGETLSSQQLEAGTHSLNTENLAAGVYFIKITCADGRTGTAKLLKELR